MIFKTSIDKQSVYLIITKKKNNIISNTVITALHTFYNVLNNIFYISIMEPSINLMKSFRAEPAERNTKRIVFVYPAVA